MYWLFKNKRKNVFKQVAILNIEMFMICAIKAVLNKKPRLLDYFTYLVHKVWADFYNFALEVASIVGNLCCYRNYK